MAQTTPTHNVFLQKIKSPFFVPPHRSGGDKDFFGNGPKVKASVTLRVSDDSKQLIARLFMSAMETKSDWSRCEGTADFSIFSCRAGQTIAELHGETHHEVNYTDTDWEEDFVIDGVGERKPKGWSLNDAPATGLTRFFRFIGDTNGSESGTRTGFQVFFNPIKVTLKGAPLDEINLGVPDGFGPPENNACSASASTALLHYYGVDISADAMWKRLRSSANVINLASNIFGENLGIDPSSVRDRLNEISNQFSLKTINDASVIDFIRDRLDERKPVLVLTGWGSKTVKDWYCRSDDCVSFDIGPGASTLHYMVVDGYNRQTDVFHVVDNGTRKYLRSNYLQNAILWNPENWFVKDCLAAINVNPGKIIWGKAKD
jgi:hypothetical protein